jgi:hypothetical protein
MVRKRFKKFLKTTGLDTTFKGKFSSIKIADVLAIIQGMEDRIYGKVTQKIDAEVDNKVTTITLGLPPDLKEDDF